MVASAPFTMTHALSLEIPVPAVVRVVTIHEVAHAHVWHHHVAHMVRCVVHHSSRVTAHGHVMGQAGVAIAAVGVTHVSHVHPGHHGNLTERREVWSRALSPAASTWTHRRHHAHGAHARNSATPAAHWTVTHGHVRVNCVS